MTETAQIRTFEPAAKIGWAAAAIGFIFCFVCNALVTCVMAVLLQIFFHSSIIVGFLLVLWPVCAALGTFYSLRLLALPPWEFRFVLANIMAFVLFSVLWCWQYHFGAPLSNLIDHVLTPWGWAVSFFVVSYFTLHRAGAKLAARLAVSAGISAVLAFSLFFLADHVFLWIYDPYY